MAENHTPEAALTQEETNEQRQITVSYTHLTLPTT